MTEQIKLEPCDIREHWDEIRPGLIELKAEWPKAHTWRPEDVYAEVLKGDAVLYKTEDGFTICTYYVEPYTRETDLYIWIGYIYPHKRGGTLKKYWPSFIEVAESLGFAGVRLESPNPAFNSYEELEPLYTVYRYGTAEKSSED